MSQENPKQTYDFICFSNLAYEFENSDRRETESKIKRRLKYYKLGKYDQQRVDYIRELKNDLYREISCRAESKFYKKSSSEFADMEDYNVEQMKLNYSAKYTTIEEDDLYGMLYFAIYLYHLR